MSSMDSGMHQNMSHDMPADMMMPCHQKDDSASMHECCESPFIDSIAHSSNSTVSDPDEVDNSHDADWKILAALHESLISNNTYRLNSPPKYWELLYDAPSNTYISLVGIIKNNS